MRRRGVEGACRVSGILNGRKPIDEEGSSRGPRQLVIVLKRARVVDFDIRTRCTVKVMIKNSSL